MPKELIVESVEQQIEIVRKTVTLPRYLSFCQDHFEGTNDRRWTKAIDSHFSGYNKNTFHPDYFRFLTLIGILWAQFGFVGLGALINRHEEKGWDLSPFNPKHILGLGCYTAKLNLQSYHYKQIYHAKEELYMSPNANLAWQTIMWVKRGIVSVPHSFQMQDTNDFIDPLTERNICLPNYPLNHAFADISFTGDDAEHMSDAQFRQDIFPQVADIIGGLMDPEAVFYQSRI